MADGNQNQRRTQVERRDEAERRLLEAGTLLVAERGLDGLTLADVGKAAGYSRGLPAHHFGSKTNFQDALIKFIIGEYKTATDIYESDPGLNTLKEIVRSSFSQSLKNPIYLCVIQIVLSDTKDNIRLAEDVVHLREATIEGIEFQIKEGVRRGEIRATANPRIAGLLLIAAICGVLELWLADRSIDVSDVGDELVGLLVDGLAIRPTA